MTDFRQAHWEYDIARYERAKRTLALITNEKFRQFLISIMTEVKLKYPQHIKEELPK